MGSSSFNRYMVECEFINGLYRCLVNKVLIDTWWNVNEEFTNYLKEAGFSFNRYMVECEYKRIRLFNYRLYCFNRYMVECEFIEDEIDRSRDLCFNRYVVECELAQGLVGCIGYAGF